ncbi:MAG: imidazole glycerol phosphate synthase subunit HisF [Candidatus Marinimicrobia bacterium]|nr:imidazole glycerol phosphate synthase subunit HisF [Candidatus Neomarinimicrobiota bacterium]
MLRSRIIPCLLVHNRGLVKTVEFKNAKYVGDPINAVKIFNEKEVDEIIVLDIDASAERRGPDFTLIKNVATECRMPLCYGGGISSVEHARQIIKLGVEKIAINYAAINNFSLIRDIGEVVGLQSVVVCIDVRRRDEGGYDIYQLNGTQKVNLEFTEYLTRLNEAGVGEVLVNSIDNDGVMTGYDIELADIVRDYTDMPNTILGGAGTYSDLKLLIDRYSIVGAAAGSIFVFKGKFRAVLISYPVEAEKMGVLSGL